MFLTIGPMLQVECADAQHLLKPCFGVKTVFNYGLTMFNNIHLRYSPLRLFTSLVGILSVADRQTDRLTEETDIL